MTKPVLTASELEQLIMAEVMVDPQCGHIAAVAITRPVGVPWDAIIVRKGAQIRPDCHPRFKEIVDRLVDQFDLAVAE